jgi:hypothetical protein
MPKELLIQESHYYSYQDEKHFFEWLESIDGIKRVVGGPQGLSIQLKGNGLNRGDLYDLIAVLMRYDIDMRGLQDFVTPKNEEWMKNPRAYWHAKIFGNKSGRTTRAAQSKVKSRRNTGK